MDQAKLFLSSFGGKANPSDPGDPIGQSLRFRGAQFLSRVSTTDGNRRTWTWSGWTKKTFLGIDSLFLFHIANNGQNDGFRTSGTDQFEWSSSFAGGSSTALFRDTSAWYHIVQVFDSTQSDASERVRLYVNGVRTLYNSLSGPNQDQEGVAGGAGNYAIGGSTATFPANSWEGYVSDVYFIDGQALEPTVFGRYNANGVWVPVRPEGLTFGSNGFHLDFSDPNDIGADRSPNGNHFTATSFDVIPPINYASLVDWPATNSQPPNYPENIFNGSEGQGTEADQCYFNTSSPVTIDLLGLLDPIDDPITSVSALVYAATTPGITLELNGVQSTVSSAAWQTVTVNHDGSPVTSFTISAATPSSLGIISFRVNGTMLVSSGNPDYDYMLDSPTQNFATLNPIDNNGVSTYSPVLVDANLGSETQTQSGLTGSTIHWNDEDVEYYFEFTHVGSSPSSTAPGVRTAQPGQPSSRTGANSFYYRSDGRIVNGATLNAGGADLATGDTWTTGDVLGTAFNPSNNRLRFFKNGAEQCDITISPSEPLQFGIYNDGVVGVAVNYGQLNGFLYQPDGTVALQTQNLPAPTIHNGREYFQAITGAGTGYLVYDEGQDSNPDPQRAAILTNPVGATPTGGFSTSSVIFDMGAPVTQASPGFNTSGGYWATTGAGYQPITTLVSLTGEAGSWTQVNEGTYIDQNSDDYIHINTTEPFRYVRMRKNTTNNFLGLATGLMKGNVWSEPTVNATNTNAPLALGEVIGGWNNQSKYGSNISTYTIVLDDPVDTFQFLVQSGWSAPMLLYVSEDGLTWRQDTQVTPGSSWGTDIVYSFSDGTPIKYARFIYNTVAGYNFGVTDPTQESAAAGILELAQNAFDSGLWWIKDRVNSNNHQLLDSVRGGDEAVTSPGEAIPSAYVAPVGDSVAWCWKAGDQVVTNSAGTLESQVSANTDAGFSIVTYTGNGANAPATIGHGLNQAPEFMILAFRNTTGQRSVYHESIGNKSRLRLNSNVPIDNNIGHWNDTSPTDTVFSVGNNFNQGTIYNYVTYCWHSVPGYSAFGTYLSTNTDNGPFVYLGFRPAFLMVKNADQAQDVSGEPATGSWMIVDSTRDADNPTTQYLRANFAGPEYDARSNFIDLLSNGFKLRTSGGEINGGSSDTYLYCAWAENPFQSPTSAR